MVGERLDAAADRQVGIDERAAGVEFPDGVVDGRASPVCVDQLVFAVKEAERPLAVRTGLLDHEITLVGRVAAGRGRVRMAVLPAGDVPAVGRHENILGLSAALASTHGCLLYQQEYPRAVY